MLLSELSLDKAIIRSLHLFLKKDPSNSIKSQKKRHLNEFELGSDQL